MQLGTQTKRRQGQSQGGKTEKTEREKSLRKDLRGKKRNLWGILEMGEERGHKWKWGTINILILLRESVWGVGG